MDVLIIGATGYIGTAVDEALSARGHRTSGTARSEAARAKLHARGTPSVAGDAAKPQTLVDAARRADAVVYCVQVTDANPWTVDSQALRAVAKALAGTEKSFVYTSGVWVYGATGDVAASEDTPLNPPPLVARRPELERQTFAMSNIGIRAHVVRPGVVYGRGAGIPAMFVQSARERGASTIVGDGTNRWATVEVGDLGELYALVLERGRPGRAYNAVGDDAFTVREIAEAASRGAGASGATTVVAPEILGPYGDCLALDQRVTAARAKADLGWEPQGRSLPADLEFGSYQGAALAG